MAAMFPARLTEGYRAFRGGRFADEQARYRMLAEKGQHPEIMVVGCVDSRVSPEVIFDASPGELLVVRNVANLVPPHEPDRGSQHGTSAALEFGVRVLMVKRVVVLGHAQCGGVAAVVDGVPKEAPDFLAPWMGLLEPVRARIPPSHGHDHTEFEKAVVKLSLENLRTFPWIDEPVRKGTLELAGFRFDIHTGVLTHLVGNEFRPVT
jgi:carbonic anhydrase